MEEFFDFIAQNFFIVILVIGGLLSLLKNKSTTNDRDREHARSSTPSESSSSNVPPGYTSDNDDLIPAYTSRSPGSSIEEQRKQQMKALEKQMGKPSSSDEQIGTNPSKFGEEPESHALDESGLNHSSSGSHNEKPYYEQRLFKKDLEGKLNRKGLINSIVMAEVLGPPRAKKPYSSIISKRK